MRGRLALVRVAVALLGALGVGSLLPGCQTTGRTLEMPPPEPPLPEMVLAPSYLTPRTQRYRIAVRACVDQTGQAAAVADASGEVLLTALDAGGRFELYDGRPLPLAPTPAVAAAASETAAVPAPAARGSVDPYRDLRGMVDGVLETSITSISRDARGDGTFEVDYRVVDPYTRMMVASGSAHLGLRKGVIVRSDFVKLAADVSRAFVDPAVMNREKIEVSDLDLDEPDVKLTLNGGRDKQVARGAVGFVVEEDPYTRVQRYLAKFVVVNVFPQASIGVIVEHCNAVGRCPEGQAILPIAQAQSVHVGSPVRFK